MKSYESTKPQAPSSREAPHPKLQFQTASRGSARCYCLRAWSLGLGTFTTILLLLLGLTPQSFAANSFVKGYLGLDVVDSAVDNLGFTYVLARDTNSQCRILKYDAVGAARPWTTAGGNVQIIPSLNPVAFCVANGTTGTNRNATTNFLYIVGKDATNGGSRIVRVQADTG